MKPERLEIYNAEAERLARVARASVKSRERNRAAGIPDLELGGRHEPCEWFAQLGFFVVLEKIGRSEPEEDWSEEGGDETDRRKFLEARRADHERIAAWLKEAQISPIAHRDGADVGGIRLMWPDRVPALKVWSGRQTLAGLAKQRRNALAKNVSDVFSFEVGIKGASGLDKGTASTPREDGFSCDALGMERVTRVGMELLAMIGLETVPITVYPDGSLEYEAGGSRWRFCIEDRNQYYGRFGTAERISE